jgi:peptidoglycan/LPS O-acetylase OafA/YrhL
VSAEGAESEAGRATLDPGKEYRAASGIPIVPALDGFRAFAIFGIVALHLIGALAYPRSDAGLILTYGPLPNLVDILFILSGFVVFLPTVARGGDFGSVGAYAMRRAARLLPAFWFAMVVVVVLLALWPRDPSPVLPSVGELGVHAVALHVPWHFFDLDFPIGLGIDGPMWTLSLELMFYLLLPLIAVAYFRHPLIGLAAGALITIAWKVGAQNMGEIANALGFYPAPERLAGTKASAYSQFPAWAFHFACGMTAAWAMVRLRELRSPEWLGRRAVWVQAGSLLAFLVLSYFFGRYALDGGALAPARARANIALTLAIPAAITLFMLATSLAPRRFQMPFALPVARRLGDISYGVYLIHFPFLLFTIALLTDPPESLEPVLNNVWFVAAVVLAASTLYGYLSGRFLEQPIRRWAHRFGRRGQTSGPGPAPEPGPTPAATR